MFVLLQCKIWNDAFCRHLCCLYVVSKAWVIWAKLNPYECHVFNTVKLYGKVCRPTSSVLGLKQCSNSYFFMQVNYILQNNKFLDYPKFCLFRMRPVSSVLDRWDITVLVNTVIVVVLNLFCLYICLFSCLYPWII